MILAFKKEFVVPILEDSKIHTIREDKPNRWKAGNKIHFATGVRTKNYKCFKKAKCISTQKIKIEREFFTGDIILDYRVYIDGRFITERKFKNLVVKDGFFSVEDFLVFFDGDFEGKIIHWTDLKY